MLEPLAPEVAVISVQIVYFVLADAVNGCHVVGRLPDVTHDTVITVVAPFFTTVVTFAMLLDVDIELILILTACVDVSQFHTP